jgi:molybdate transport system permease protein
VAWFELTPAETEAVLLSMRVAGSALALGLPLALATAYVLARKEFPGKSLVNALVYLPLVMPPVVTGYLLLLVLGRRGPLGALLEQAFGLVLSFRWTGAVVAAAVMAFPLIVRPIRLSIESVDRRLEEAAATLGASAPMVFATVTLPMIVPGIIAGAILGFAKSLGEFGATITFVSNIPGETQTLALAVYGLLQVPGQEAGAVRLTALAVALSVLALLVSEWLARRARRRMEL